MIIREVGVLALYIQYNAHAAKGCEGADLHRPRQSRAHFTDRIFYPLLVNRSVTLLFSKTGRCVLFLFIWLQNKVMSVNVKYIYNEMKKDAASCIDEFRMC